MLDIKLDTAVVELPMQEAELTIGFRFPPQDRLLAVASSHPLADSDRVHVEALAGLDILLPTGDAPDYWMVARVPRATPAGAPIRSTKSITSAQGGLALVATDDHTMLVCRPLPERANRSDVRYLPFAAGPNLAHRPREPPTGHAHPAPPRGGPPSDDRPARNRTHG
ncbi:hypothetical protein ACFVFQ_34875 [Streptomyces sp. NPDC057743]|uniref:hypothetical protein n=1 Tax=Streptomyces sp. NPDC057743 TaxID=3346236 RepID=UPI0036C30FDB